MTERNQKIKYYDNGIKYTTRMIRDYGTLAPYIVLNKKRYSVDWDKQENCYVVDYPYFIEGYDGDLPF